MSTDRIEKTSLLRATRARVWRAISDPAEFGRWFGVRFDDGAAFVPGTTLRGRITTPGYEHVVWTAEIERVEPEHVVAFRWRPYAIEPGVDYSSEPTTLVELVVEDAEGGTKLTMRESGFERVPVARRAEAYRMNDQGWSIQIENVARHVAE